MVSSQATVLFHAICRALRCVTVSIQQFDFFVCLLPPGAKLAREATSFFIEKGILQGEKVYKIKSNLLSFLWPAKRKPAVVCTGSMSVIDQSYSLFLPASLVLH